MTMLMTNSVTNARTDIINPTVDESRVKLELDDDSESEGGESVKVMFASGSSACVGIVDCKDGPSELKIFSRFHATVVPLVKVYPNTC